MDETTDDARYDIKYDTAPGTVSTVRAVTRTATALWLVVSALNVVVWLLVSIISGDIDRPWFLWAFAGGGTVVGALRVASRRVAGRSVAKVAE